MKNLILTLAFTLIGTFAFANNERMPKSFNENDIEKSNIDIKPITTSPSPCGEIAGAVYSEALSQGASDEVAALASDMMYLTCKLAFGSN